MSRRLYALIAVALAVVIFVAINIAADNGLTTAKLDLTANGQFTLSQGTRNIVAGLKEPVTLKFYYSKQTAAEYAQTAQFAKRVRDLLSEYAASSHGKIVLEEVDPEPFTEAEDQATAAGITGAPTDSGDVVYFGLVGTNAVDGREVIPYFTAEREEYLEYDLTSLIYRLSTPKKPLIGLLGSIQLATGPGGLAAMMQGQSQPYTVYLEMQQIFQTQVVPPVFKEIPKSIDVLLIAHPTNFTPEQLQAIDQFALNGGRVLLFVDPSSDIASQTQPNPYNPVPPSPSSDMPALLKAWGVAYDPNKVVADRKYAQRVQVRDPMNPVALYPVWLHVPAEGFDKKDTVTASLQSLNLASVGALHPLKGATTSFTPLIWSSDQASLLDASTVRATQNPNDLMAMVEPTGEKFTIAARISGEAKTAFPATAKTKSGKVNVVVIADTDVFDDRFWVRVQNVLGKKIAAPFADNGGLVLNAVENLTGSGDLISLRTRETVQRPFTVVQDLQAKAQEQFQQKEKSLQQHLTETQQRLHELEQGGNTQSGTEAGLTPAQQAEIERFRRDARDTRNQLRDVQHNLRKDIDSLGSWLAFINIALVPILIAIFAIVLASLRRRKRLQARAST
ncbi:MAG: Gldg family protein [Alphaproteobacteria bacterium]|nr:Gldg family protein [Alphaproteobacteria bacterium]